MTKNMHFRLITLIFTTLLFSACFLTMENEEDTDSKINDSADTLLANTSWQLSQDNTTPAKAKSEGSVSFMNGNRFYMRYQSFYQDQDTREYITEELIDSAHSQYQAYNNILSVIIKGETGQRLETRYWQYSLTNNSLDLKTIQHYSGSEKTIFGSWRDTLVKEYHFQNQILSDTVIYQIIFKTDLSYGKTVYGKSFMKSDGQILWSEFNVISDTSGTFEVNGSNKLIFKTPKYISTDYFIKDGSLFVIQPLSRIFSKS